MVADTRAQGEGDGVAAERMPMEDSRHKMAATGVLKGECSQLPDADPQP
jgi:hypothetical protein